MENAIYRNATKRSHLAGMKSSLPDILEFNQKHLWGTQILSGWVRRHQCGILVNFPTDCAVKQKPHHPGLFLRRNEDPLKVVSVPSAVQDARVGFFQWLGVRL